MTVEDIQWLIVQLIADDSGMSPADLLAELREAGESMPVDSLLAAEVLARVEEAVGVDLPTSAETARALRSVKAFAEAVYRLMPQVHQEGMTA